MTGFWWVHTSGQRNQETVKFLSGPCTAEWAIDCFLYSPPSFFLNTAINFLSCLTNSFSLPSLPLALFVAEEDAQSFGEILQTTQPLQPGWTGPVPGSLSGDQPENKNSPGICAYTCKTGRKASQRVTIHLQDESLSSTCTLVSYHSNFSVCLVLFKPHPASRLPCVFLQPGKPATKAPRLPVTVELKMPLLHYSLYIHSWDHRLMWWMMCLGEGPCTDPMSGVGSASLDVSIYTTHCVWSHRINIWACLLFSRGHFFWLVSFGVSAMQMVDVCIAAPSLVCEGE